MDSILETTKKVVNFYDYLSRMDVITKGQNLFLNKGYHIDDDDRINSVKRMMWKSTWLYVKHSGNRKCHLWHTVYFDEYGLIPEFCHQCWKVCIRMKTLKQLFAMADLQKKMDRPGKCGTEERERVRSLYGGYFYNDSLEEGLECWELVKEEMAKSDILKDLLVAKDPEGRLKNVILKRGCTEFEHSWGPSTEWEISEDQLEFEKELDRTFDQHIAQRTQPEVLVRKVLRDWIHFAWEHDDPTVEEFTGGLPLFPPLVVYHPPEGGKVGEKLLLKMKKK